MKKDRPFTYEELENLSEKISRPTFDFFNKQMKMEMRRILKDRTVLKYDVFRILTSSIFDVLINVFSATKVFIEKENLKIDFNDIIKAHAQILEDHFNVKNKETIN